MSKPLSLQGFAGIPSGVEGRIMADDYIYFVYTERDVFPIEYNVAVQKDNGKFEVVGSLSGRFPVGGHSIKLPFVAYSSDNSVVVIPKFPNPQAPKYLGSIKRGYTYKLSIFSKRLNNGYYLME